MNDRVVDRLITPETSSPRSGEISPVENFKLPEEKLAVFIAARVASTAGRRSSVNIKELSKKTNISPGDLIVFLSDTNNLAKIRQRVSKRMYTVKILIDGDLVHLKAAC
jgi:fructose-1,6-bisphosphatase/sedoheptulose 1,7-bisphosphatase-like protein